MQLYNYNQQVFSGKLNHEFIIRTKCSRRF